MSRSNYTATIKQTTIGPVIYVIDLFEYDSPTMTVTNDAEAVIQEVTYRYGDHRVFYRDTEGQIDELCHKDGRFTTFMPGDPTITKQLEN